RVRRVLEEHVLSRYRSKVSVESKVKCVACTVQRYTLTTSRPVPIKRRIGQTPMHGAKSTYQEANLNG
ncbi:MAG: hypothetical protein ACJA0J_000161, partial [Bdellovibrionota bacterium]